MDERTQHQTVKNNIHKYLKEGLFKKDAAVLAGISEATFYRWLDDDESFKSQVEANIAEYKLSLIKTVNTAAIKNGKLALEVLQKRWPKDWIEEKDEKWRNDEAELIADLMQTIFDMERKINELKKEKSINQDEESNDAVGLFS